MRCCCRDDLGCFRRAGCESCGLRFSGDVGNGYGGYLGCYEGCGADGGLERHGARS
jgi:hypothetical protein